MKNLKDFKRGQISYIKDRGYGRTCITIRGEQEVVGEMWLVAQYGGEGTRMCVHPSSLEAA